MTRRRQSNPTFKTMLGLTVVLICAAFSGNGVMAQVQGTPFEFKSGMIVDHQSGLAFLMHPDGGTDALDLASGTVVWHSAEAGRPLAVINDKLLAQVEMASPGRMDLVLLESISGEVLESVTAALPADKTARVGNGLGSTFDAWAAVQGPEVTIGWKSARQEIRGTGSSPVQLTSDGARLNTNTGVVTTGVAAPTRASTSRELRNTGSVRIANVVGRQFFSADETHVLASEVLKDRWGYQWRLYTREGNLIGEIESPVSYAPFFVSGSLVVFLLQPEARAERGRMITSPLRLLAVELNTGSETWSHEVRDTTYRGPYPP